MAEVIKVGAVVIRNGRGEVLTVRKNGAELFQLPGGKPEIGETMPQTVIREAAEEVGIRLDPQHLRYLGEFTATAANEPGHDVTGTIFTYPDVVDGFAPHAEIAELKWVDPVPFAEGCAPLLSTRIFPALG